MTNSAQCVFDGGDCLGWYFILDGLYMLMRLEGEFTYHKGKIACENLGAKIFEPIFLNHTKEIWALIEQNGQGLFWTGINDVAEEGKYVHFRFTYGSLLDHFRFTSGSLPVHLGPIDVNPII